MSVVVGFRNVTHSYEGVKALDNLSFDIALNEITAIIGKSGGGKSTLIQIINGLIRPTGGDVIVYGQKLDYSKINEIRLKIGYSVQGTGLFPHMSSYDNIALLGIITKKPRHEIELRIDLLMSFVGLLPVFKKKYPHELSGGEQQRVGICRAMLLNPQIFLLDEAFGALDPSTKNEIHKELLKLQEFEPRTIIMVTHDLNEAAKLADNIMIIDKGVIQQFDKKNNVLNSPANDFVKDFIKSQSE
jgi:osmoprotectant transport system ATP-binding protein